MTPDIEALKRTIAAIKRGNIVHWEQDANFSVETVEALLSELASLRSEQEGMREGLKPFAAVAESDIGVDEADDDLFRQASREYARAPRITVGDFRRARALLHQGEGE